MTQVDPSINILVIDDRPANVRFLLQVLTEQGYNPRPATQGAFALRAAQLAPPDLILLDIRMPGMDGYELCKRFKADTRTQHIPIIFLTVLDDLADVVKGFSLGAVDYIPKPVKTEELIARIENQIQLRSLEKKLAAQNKQLQDLLAQYQVTELALRESEEKFSKAFQHSPIPLSIASFPEGRYLDVNQEFERQTGYARDEAIGRTVLELNFWVDLEERMQMLQLIQSQGYVRNFESTLQSKYGEIRTVISSIEMIRLDDHPYYLIASKDITELKAVQKSLAARSQELAETLETLQKTQSQLIESAKMAALGNLVAGVAHEINTPVGTAIMMASTLENSTQAIATDIAQSALTQAKFDGYLEVATEASHLILDNLHRAGDLIQSFKQVAVDQASLKARSFNVKTYLKEIITNLSSQLKPTSHQVLIGGDDDLEVYSYPGAFSQIITNLVMNAIIHAFPENQVGEIYFEISHDQDQWQLIYRDNGVGIAAEHIDHIFEPFYTTARHKGGSGLGLHLVYNLVMQSLKGTVSVNCDQRQGTTFLIKIPYGSPPGITEQNSLH